MEAVTAPQPATPEDGADEPRCARSGWSPCARSSSAAAAAATSCRSLFTRAPARGRVRRCPSLLIGQAKRRRSALVEPAPAGLEAAHRRRSADAVRRRRSSSAASPTEAAGEAARPRRAGSTPRSSSRPTCRRPGELIVLDDARRPAPGDRRASAVIALRAGARPALLDAADRRRRSSRRPAEDDDGADLRQRRDHPHVHRHLLVRHVGADRRRRGEAEPGRRGRAVDRPAARPADGQGARDRRSWPSPSSWCSWRSGSPLRSSAGGSPCPPTTAGAVVQLLTWFILGFAFYSTTMGFLGSLASRMEEASNASMPVTMIATPSLPRCRSCSSRRTRTASSPRVLTFFPPSAPMVVPLRTALDAIAAVGDRPVASR